ncbi:MAG TPA: YfhO family protein [Acidimicrobiales bacterium]|nr:YfhO family protein [Acidimicrobiales bacterium]
MGWTVLAAFAVLAPALRPGVSLGPFDLLSWFGLTAHHGVQVHNPLQSDQIQQFLPWINLAWQQVHSGHLPLWNPYSVMGMPLAFNWQSGVFSLPVALAYLFPVHLAYTVVVLARLVTAGTGAYVLCRVLGLSSLSSAFAGTAFELSGPVVAHSGWPTVGVLSWGGWILAMVLLVVQGRHRFGHVALLGAFAAFAVYGGDPESLVVLVVAVVVFLAVYGLAGRRRVSARSLMGLGAAGCLGVAWSAPLLFPGVELASASARRGGTGMSGYSVTHVLLLLGSFDGASFPSLVYVGVITSALALTGAVVVWGRPEVRALVAMVALCAVLSFVSLVDDALHAVPLVGTVTWTRSVMVLALGLAVLGAVGLDALAAALTGVGRGPAIQWATRGLLGCGVVLVFVAAGVAAGAWLSADHNWRGFIAPGVELVVGLLVVSRRWRGWFGLRRERLARTFARLALPVVVAVQSLALVAAGISYWSMTSGYFPETAGTAALQVAAGSSLVGLGSCGLRHYLARSSQPAGILANANVAYEVDELDVYDPILPTAYFKLWRSTSGRQESESLMHVGVFCPQVSTVAEARLFGVQYVLETPGRPGPTGAVFAGRMGDEALYRIPRSGRATVSAVPAGRGRLALEAPGTPVPFEQLGPGSYQVVLFSTVPQVLRLRLTAVPGWRATIDGRPAPVSTWADHIMVQLRVPAGNHVVELRYWPTAFMAGLVVALVALAGCALSGLVVVLSRRRPRVVRAAINSPQ